MPDINKSEVRIGKTDGFRYIAVKPPLSIAERQSLLDNTHHPFVPIEDVPGPSGKACTMLQYDVGLPELAILRRPEVLLQVAKYIASALNPARCSIVHSKEVQMGWGNSSPFNPNPNQ